MTLDRESCYRIVGSRDARYDGLFFTGVVTTGIYCRPVCPAKTPKLENVQFYPCAAAAEAAGFRPCKRCRPETAPGTPAWNGTSTTVSRGLRLIARGYLDHRSVEDLAATLGMGTRHLRRLFLRHVGAAPKAVALSQRLHFASQLLQETDRGVTEVALASGFGSIRRFNDAFKGVFAVSPSEFRARGARQRTPPFDSTIALSYRPPFQWEALLRYFGARALDGIEETTGGSYRRSIRFGESLGVIEVRPAPAGNKVQVRVEGVPPQRFLDVVGRVRRMFDLDADPEAVGAHLSRDCRMAELVAALPGLRIPGVWDPFEAVVRAIVGQQVSVAGARATLNAIAKRFGPPLPQGGTLTRLFPSADDLAAADLSTIAMPAARSRTLSDAAKAVASGRIKFDDEPRALEESLLAIAGIGPWTAGYVALRASGEPDAFPENDLGLRKAIEALGYGRLSAEERSLAIEEWRPWRGYAAMYLWTEGPTVRRSSST